eukprot:Selendium_serpulae@DN10971_c0_g1_i1.p1
MGCSFCSPVWAPFFLLPRYREFWYPTLTTTGSKLYSKNKHVRQAFPDFTFIPSKTTITLDMKHYPYTIDPNRAGHLYIWGDYYLEGMSNWIKRVAELLM